MPSAVGASASIDGEERLLMLGQPQSRTLSLVCRLLQELIAERLQQRSKVLRERRRAKEEGAEYQKGLGNSNNNKRRQRGGGGNKDKDEPAKKDG